MKITNVKVNKVKKEDSRLRGMATITLDDEIAIHNIRIIEGNNGLFIAMPSKKVEEDKYMDLIHPIKSEVRKEMEQKILEVYGEEE